jgi:hypothetical protein
MPHIVRHAALHNTALLSGRRQQPVMSASFQLSTADVYYAACSPMGGVTGRDGLLSPVAVMMRVDDAAPFLWCGGAAAAERACGTRVAASLVRWHSTAPHSTAQHSTAQHSTAQHSTAQHSSDARHTDGSATAAAKGRYAPGACVAAGVAAPASARS